MDTVKLLNQSHQAALSAVTGLTTDEWNRLSGCGKWSVKDLMAHLAAFEQVLVDVLTSVLDDSPTPALGRLLEGYFRFNGSELNLRHDWTVDDVLLEYMFAHEQTVALLAQLPDETRQQKGLLRWYGEDFDLDDFISQVFYGHKQEYIAQIMTFRYHMAREANEESQYAGELN